MYRQQIERYFEEHKEALLEDICRLIRIPSDKKPPLPGLPFGQGPADALAEALAIASAMGFKTKNYDNYVGTADLNDKEPGLDILAHLDVVPAGEGWSVTGPFEPVVADGRLYGRGSADDKGPAVCALYAMKAVRDLGIPLSKNVRLILGTDEESGSSDIAYYYQAEEEAPMTFSPDAEFPLINIEKGGIRGNICAEFAESNALPRILSVQGGEKVNVVPGKAQALLEGISPEDAREACEAFSHKTGLLLSFSEEGGKLRITAAGKGAHAASPQTGNNAVTGLLELLASMPLAAGEGFDRLCSLSKLFPHGDWEGKAAGVAQKDDLSGELTISLNVLTYGVTGLSSWFDSRCPICANDANMRDVILEKCRLLGLKMPAGRMYPPHHVPEESEFIQTLLKCYEQYTGQKGECLAIGGGTYVHGLKNGVAFGCSMPGTDNKMHGADESAVVEELLLSAKIFTQAIIELCG